MTRCLLISAQENNLETSNPEEKERERVVLEKERERVVVVADIESNAQPIILDDLQRRFFWLDMKLLLAALLGKLLWSFKRK